eukprot:51681-Eustigmatos_ZCMA.PRE.1
MIGIKEVARVKFQELLAAGQGTAKRTDLMQHAPPSIGQVPSLVRGGFEQLRLSSAGCCHGLVVLFVSDG